MYLKLKRRILFNGDYKMKINTIFSSLRLHAELATHSIFATLSRLATLCLFGLATCNSLYSMLETLCIHWMLEHIEYSVFFLICTKHSLFIHTHKRNHTLNILSARLGRLEWFQVPRPNFRYSIWYATWDIWLQLLGTGESSGPFPRIAIPQLLRSGILKFCHVFKIIHMYSILYV